MDLTEKAKEFIYLIRQRFHLINFLISVLCLITLGIQISLTTSTFQIFHLGYNLIVLVSGLYSLFFLPFYPIFFIIKRSRYNKLEKLVLTILVNFAFYIIIGYFGFLLGFQLTSLFFYILTVGSYLVCIISALIFLSKRGNMNILVNSIDPANKEEFVRNFSFRHYFKERFSLNIVLLIVFIFLLCFFNLIGNSPFCGTDPWLHIGIIKMITEMHFLPFTDYHGAMGIHIFGSVLYYFSRIEYLLIPSLYIFISFPLSGLIIYMFLQKIFSKKNISILGTFVSMFSAIGYGPMMQILWPQTMAFMQCLLIFYILYLRLERFIEMKGFNLKLVFSNMSFSYALILLLFLSAYVTHSLTTLVMLITFLWVFLVFFLKDFRRGIDFLLICLLGGIFMIFFQLDIATGFFTPFSNIFNLPFYYYILMGIGLIIGLGPILRFLIKRLNLQKEPLLKIDYNLLKKYQKREFKYIIPIAIGIVMFLTFLFFIGNTFIFNFDMSTMFTFLEICIFCAFSIWGFIIFQKSIKGRVFFIWLIGFALIMLAGLFYNVSYFINTLLLRLLSLASPVFIIGFISYIYKLIKIKVSKKKKFKIFLLVIITFSLFSSIYEISKFYNSSINNNEVSISQWYGKYTLNNNTLIGRPGIGHVFLYYNYPYEMNNRSLGLTETIKPMCIQDHHAIPEEHIKDSINLLQQLKSTSKKDVFILLPSDYLSIGGMQIYGRLTQEDRQKYYNLSYVNRIFSSKTTDMDRPLYWVI